MRQSIGFFLFDFWVSPISYNSGFSVPVDIGCDMIYTLPWDFPDYLETVDSTLDVHVSKWMPVIDGVTPESNGFSLFDLWGVPINQNGLLVPAGISLEMVHRLPWDLPDHRETVDSTVDIHESKGMPYVCYRWVCNKWPWYFLRSKFVLPCNDFCVPAATIFIVHVYLTRFRCVAMICSSAFETASRLTSSLPIVQDCEVLELQKEYEVTLDDKVKLEHHIKTIGQQLLRFDPYQVSWCI